MADFRDIYAQLQKSDAYQAFMQEDHDYYLVHGFVQLDAGGEPSKPWHIGFYSPSKDDLAVFSAPDFSLEYDEAFKKGGTIDELAWSEDFKSTSTILDGIGGKLVGHDVMTQIVVLQTVEGQPRYNITVVTKAFKMLTFIIDPMNGEIVEEKESSVMDLKA